MPNTADSPLSTMRTDLEARLRGPEGAALRHTHLTRLHTLAGRLHTELGRGLGPDAYATGRALAHSIDAAITILDSVASEVQPEGNHFPPGSLYSPRVKRVSR
ncbi:hypothetical protein GOQ28_06480 [Bordetella sp. 02P26C-1]|nr:hypothetical protein [Bordetella sp. 02P26C-1]